MGQNQQPKESMTMTQANLVFSIEDVKSTKTEELHKILDAFVALANAATAPEEAKGNHTPARSAAPKVARNGNTSTAVSAEARLARRAFPAKRTTKDPKQRVPAKLDFALPTGLPQIKNGERWWTGPDQAENREVIRQWAIKRRAALSKQGISVGKRGAISADVVAAYVADQYPENATS